MWNYAHGGPHISHHPHANEVHISKKIALTNKVELEQVYLTPILQTHN